MRFVQPAFSSRIRPYLTRNCNKIKTGQKKLTWFKVTFEASEHYRCEDKRDDYIEIVGEISEINSFKWSIQK